MIVTHQLTRHFGDLIAVNDLSLSLQSGELFGFLGANGAGKTTTLRMLVGLLVPTRGMVTIGGNDIQNQPMQAKRRFGYLAQTPLLYDNLTGREFLSFLGGLHRLPNEQIEERSAPLIGRLGLGEQIDRLVGGYSGGQRRKIALIGALLHDPDALILDEPFAGLDPISARHVKNILADLCASGKTVLMSTHTLEIAERVCTRLGIIDSGRLIADGALDELRGARQSATLEDLFITLAADHNTAEMVQAL